MTIPVTEIDFWDYPNLIPELKEKLPSDRGLMIVLPAIEPVEVADQDRKKPHTVYNFPRFEFRMTMKLRPEPGEVFVQARPALDRIRYYLALSVGEMIPVASWVMSHTSHAPPQRLSQPLFPWLVFRQRTPSEVYDVFLKAYEQVEALLAKIVLGSPLDLGVRSYGESLTASDYRSAFVSLWRAMEVLGRRYGPGDVPEGEGRRMYAFLSDLGLAPDDKTFTEWRLLRNQITHGLLDDQVEREVHRAHGALLELVRKVIISLIANETGIRIDPIADQMLRPK